MVETLGNMYAETKENAEAGFKETMPHSDDMKKPQYGCQVRVQVLDLLRPSPQ